MKNSFKRSFAVLTAVLLIFLLTIPASAGYYTHDPMQNPKAAADIIEDPNAVYGYAPDPLSKRLGVYAEFDWSDEAVVAEMRKEREEYHDSIKELYQIKADMEAQGATIEAIARAVSTRRNEIRMESYKDDPEGLEKLKESNLASFGNENGGTPDYFYEKYGSWETVIEKAFSTNAGADAILGLYDKYYDTYIIDEDETETEQTESTQPESAEPKTEPEPDTVAVTETAAESVTETATVAATASPTSAAGDSSKTSPNTGDPVIILLILIITASGAAVVCIITLHCQHE